MEIVLADTGRLYVRHLPTAALCCQQGHLGRGQARNCGEDQFGDLPIPKKETKASKVKTHLFDVQWARSGENFRAIVRAESALKAVKFCRKHYGDRGPAARFQVEQTCEADTVNLRCDKLNAQQLSFS